MRIESSFSLVDKAVSVIQKQAESMRIISSDVGNTRTAVPEIVSTENDIGAEAGLGSCASRINLEHLPNRMTNLDIAVQTYKTNVGVLERYRQMTEIKLELLG